MYKESSFTGDAGAVCVIGAARGGVEVGEGV